MVHETSAVAHNGNSRLHPSRELKIGNALVQLILNDQRQPGKTDRCLAETVGSNPKTFAVAWLRKLSIRLQHQVRSFEPIGR